MACLEDQVRELCRQHCVDVEYIDGMYRLRGYGFQFWVRDLRHVKADDLQPPKFQLLLVPRNGKPGF